MPSPASEPSEPSEQAKCLQEAFIVNHIKATQQPDFVLVFPAGPQKDDDVPLETNTGDWGSARSYVRNIIPDESIFTAGVVGGETEGEQFDDQLDAELSRAFSAATTSKTKGELRERIVALILRYLTSRHCCFKVSAFASADSEKFLLTINVGERVLRAHADLMNYELQLDEGAATMLLDGRFQRDELVPAFIKYDLQAELKYRQVMSQKIGNAPESRTSSSNGDGEKRGIGDAYASPFKRYFGIIRREEGGSIFRSLDRIKIVEAALKKHLNIDALVEMGIMSSRYCCHSKRRQKDLFNTWGNVKHIFSLSVPLNSIADYLGEKVGFRMCFIEFLAKALVPLALLGPFYYVMPKSAPRWSIMGVFVSLWSAFFTQFWARTESRWKTIWGMEQFAYSETVRPQFIGTWEKSTVDRMTLVKVYPVKWKRLRKLIVRTVGIMFNLLNITVIAVLFVWRAHCQKKGQTEMYTKVCIINSVQMQVFNAVWTKIAFKLTDFENLETDTKYAEQVIKRIFVFRFLNSFAPLFYIAFIKHFNEGCEHYGSCELELAAQLRSSFGISVFCSLVFPLISYIRFRISHTWHAWKEARKHSQDYLVAGSESIASSPCYIELQNDLDEYSLYEEISDDVECIMGMGFILFFGIVAPEVFALFLLDNLLRLRMIGFKMICGMQRAFPDSAAGIGIWNKVIRLMCAFSFVSNIALVIMLNSQREEEDDVFLSVKQLLSSKPENNVPRDHDWRAMLITFFMTERVAALVIMAIFYFIPDIPADVLLARKRREAMVAAYAEILTGTTEGGELKLVYEGLDKGELRVQTLQRANWQAQDIANLAELSRTGISNENFAPNRLASWTPDDPGFVEAWYLGADSRNPEEFNTKLNDEDI